MDDIKIEFLEAFNKTFEKLVEDRKKWLLENKSGEYVCGSWHYSGTYANSPEYYEYDEGRAYDDAREDVIAGLVNIDDDYIFNLFDNIEFSKELAKYLRSL